MRKSDEDAEEFEASEDRFTSQDGMWYFKSREGLKGPFGSRLDAEEMLSGYIATMEYLEEHQVPDQFDPTDVTVMRLDEEVQTTR